MPRKRLVEQRRRFETIEAIHAWWERQMRFHGHGRFGCPVINHPLRGSYPVCFFDGDPARYRARKRGWRTSR